MKVHTVFEGDEIKQRAEKVVRGWKGDKSWKRSYAIIRGYDDSYKEHYSLVDAESPEKLSTFLGQQLHNYGPFSAWIYLNVNEKGKKQLEGTVKRQNYYKLEDVLAEEEEEYIVKQRVIPL